MSPLPQVALLTDSLGMPREKKIGDIPVAFTYPVLTAEKLAGKAEVFLYAERARTMDKAAQVAKTLTNFSVLFLHIGVVDCYPRVFCKKDHDIFGQISSPLREELQTFVRENKTSLMQRLGNIVYTPLIVFEENLRAILQHAKTNNTAVIVANIVDAEPRTPFLIENINTYNNVIHTLVAEFDQTLFDARSIALQHGGYKEMLLEDNHHLSVFGNRIFAHYLTETLFHTLEV